MYIWKEGNHTQYLQITMETTADWILRELTVAGMTIRLMFEEKPIIGKICSYPMSGKTLSDRSVEADDKIYGLLDRAGVKDGMGELTR